MAAYREHDRVVVAESETEATLALLSDWRAAWQDAERDATQDVVVLAHRRAEVDRLNTQSLHDPSQHYGWIRMSRLVAWPDQIADRGRSLRAGSVGPLRSGDPLNVVGTLD